MKEGYTACCRACCRGIWKAHGRGLLNWQPSFQSHRHMEEVSPTGLYSLSRKFSDGPLHGRHTTIPLFSLDHFIAPTPNALNSRLDTWGRGKAGGQGRQTPDLHFIPSQEAASVPEGMPSASAVLPCLNQDSHPDKQRRDRVTPHCDLSPLSFPERIMASPL